MMVPRNCDNRLPHFGVEQLESRTLLAAAPGLIQSFEGINAQTSSSQNGFIAYPPDPSIAAGPSQLVTVVNNSIEWYTKTGTRQNSQSIKSFFSSLAPAMVPFDPKAVYDQYSGRFIVVALEQTVSPRASRILIAVSKSSDAAGGWYFQAINAKQTANDADYWANYPGLAVDANALYVTANMDAFDADAAYAGSRLWICPKSSFYNGGGIVAKVYDPAMAAGLAEQNLIQPAQMFGTAPTNVGTFLVYSYVYGDYTDYVGVIRVDSPLGTPSFTHQYVDCGDISSYLDLGDAPQQGSTVTLETYNPYNLNAVWRNNALWVAGTVNPPTGVDAGQSTAHWYKINTSNLASLTVADQGSVSGETLGAGTHTFYPWLAVDAAGNMAMGFGASGPNLKPGAYYTARAAGDAAGTTRTPVTLAAGQAVYGGTTGATVQPWGEYSGMALDPDGATFWAYNEYARPAVGSVNTQWGTHIGGFTFGNSPPPPPPTQSPFKGSPFAIPTTIQAEDFDNGGDGLAWHDSDTTNQGGKYRTTGVDIEATTDTGGGYNLAFNKAGEWLEYTINVASANTYNIGLRVAASGSGGSAHIEIDGVNVTGTIALPDTGGWQKWATVTKTGVSLPAGQHVLRLCFDTAGPLGYLSNVNSISITAGAPPVQNQTPFKGSPFALPATIQLEDFDNGGDGLAWHDSDGTNQGGKYRTTGVDIEAAADTGGGYDIGFVKPGEWLEYSVNVPTTGSYSFSLRTAYGGTLANGGTAHLEMDGADVSGAITLPKTGGWQTWQTVSANISLTAGQHVLRLSFDKDGSGGTSGYLGNANWMAITAAPAAALPAPWTSSDIGAVGKAGSAGYSNGVYALQASGADVWGTADALRFVYQSLTGDGQIVAKVESIGNTNAWAKAGVMFRDGLAANAKNAYMAVSPTSGMAFQGRTTAGGTSAGTASPGTAPFWVKLVRSGNSFSGYKSIDGSTWTQVGSAMTISMGSTVYVGLASTGHNNTALGSSTYSNVSVTPISAAHGLVGGYYNNRDLTGLAFTRTDAYLNMTLGSGGVPDSRIATDYWSVRWTGKIVPRYSETYTIYTTNDDGARVWVNGQLLIDDWFSHAAFENRGTIALQAGVKYDIKVEYYNDIGGATISLAWSSASQAKEVVPTSQLFVA